MSCTAPVDIVKDTSNICDMKCDYTFDYIQQNSLKLKNEGTHIVIQPLDKSNSPPVTFFADKYSVKEMRLYYPSLHTYNGKPADAELIIVHDNVTGSGGYLCVCIPIILGNGKTDSIFFFDKMMFEMTARAPSANTKTTLTMNSFSLNNIIPIKPYYSYSGTMPAPSCANNAEYVVFSTAENAEIAISKKAFTALKTIISPHAMTVKKNPKGVFYNKKGTIKNSEINGDMYFECNPAGDEGETFIPVETTQGLSFNNNKKMKMALLIIGLIMFILIILYILYVFLQYIRPTNMFANKTR